MIFTSQEIEDFKARIMKAGLFFTEENPRWHWTFFDDVIEFKVGQDRSEQFVTVGPRRSTGFVMTTWAKLLGIDPPRSKKFESQLEYALANLNAIRRATESDSDISAKLLEVNWSLVKKRLNLDPDTPMPS